MIAIVEVTGYIFGFPRGSGVITSSARGISPVAPNRISTVIVSNLVTDVSQVKYSGVKSVPIGNTFVWGASVFNMGTSISTNRISTAIISNLVTDVLLSRISGIKAVKPFTVIVSNLVTDVSWVKYSGVKSVPIGNTFVWGASVFNMGTSISTNRISTAIVSNLVTDVLWVKYSGISANRTGINQTQSIQFWS